MGDTEKPTMIETPDLKELKKICQDYINSIATDEWVDEDYPHYIYEVAIETLFGKNVWDFINRRKK